MNEHAHVHINNFFITRTTTCVVYIFASFVESYTAKETMVEENIASEFEYIIFSTIEAGFWYFHVSS